jgi:predicted nuclease of predicted toxin-antitoxin system
MISPYISPGLWEAGVDNYPVRDRGLLQASDYEVWARAKLDLRTLVTINAIDFLKIAERDTYHYGLIIIPNGGTRSQQLKYILTATTYAQFLQITFDNLLVTVADDYSVTAAEVRAARPVSP